MADVKNGIQKLRNEIAKWDDVSIRAAKRRDELKEELESLKREIDAPIEPVASKPRRRKKAAPPATVVTAPATTAEQLAHK